jgi:diguanylate cyclase (GGDEF)-like protein
MGYLVHTTTHDSLTHLPNRLLFLDRLEQALRHAKRNGERFVVALLSLDRFKTVNDSLGHQTGDALLREVAARLRGSVREQDTVARLGGDQFAMVLPGITNTDVAMHLLGKITGSFATPILVNELMLRSSVSLGGCLWTGSCWDTQVLLALADQAMYRAKRAGGNAFLLKTTTPDAVAVDLQMRHTPDPGVLAADRRISSTTPADSHASANSFHWWASRHGPRVRPRAGYVSSPQARCWNLSTRTSRPRGRMLAISSSLSDPESTRAQDLAPGEMNTTPRPRVYPKSARVLFVSDDAAVRNATQLFLRASGYNAQAVSSAEALADARNYVNLDLILADYCLKGPLTGADVICAVGIFAGARLKALLLTYDPSLTAWLSQRIQDALVAERPLSGDGLIALLERLRCSGRLMSSSSYISNTHE